MTDIPDIEVGRYALRTFRLVDGKLKSLFQSTYWDGGTMIAECRAGTPCDIVPSENCHCGLYGTLTLDHLVKQYAADARRNVAVIAAEGSTLIGDRGLRTSAARIVAYWAPDQAFADYRNADLVFSEVYASICPDARRFEDKTEMLEAYHFPASPFSRSFARPPTFGLATPAKKLGLDLLSSSHPGLTAGGKAALQYVVGFLNGS